jgi:hypothetical protein
VALSLPEKCAQPQKNQQHREASKIALLKSSGVDKNILKTKKQKRL